MSESSESAPLSARITIDVAFDTDDQDRVLQNCKGVVDALHSEMSTGLASHLLTGPDHELEIDQYHIGWHVGAQTPASHWDDHPEYPVDDWRHEVANNDTRLGYAEWCAHKAEAGQDKTFSHHQGPKA